MRHRIGIALVALLALACGNLEAWAQKVGPEFRVNSFTTSNQEQPSVARLSNGGFVVTWQSAGQDGSGSGIYGQRYSAAGAPVGVEFQVNTVTANSQSQPSVAGLTGGRFVVTWRSADASLNGVYGQRYNGAGAREGGEFRINITTPDHQQSPSVAGLSNGGFVVIWQSFAQDGSANGVYGRRYSPTGVRIGGEFQVNTFTTNNQQSPSVAGLSGGGFVVTWTSFGQDRQDNSDDGVYGQRYSAAGARAGGEFRVSTHTFGPQDSPSVAALSNGGFVVAWRSQGLGQDGSLSGIYSQRYSAAGVPVGVEFRANKDRAGPQDSPSVAGLSGGGFVITWTTNPQNARGGKDVLGLRYTAAGANIGVPARVNTTTASDQFNPSVAALSNGGFVVTWQSSGNQDGSGSGVYGQRYSP